MTAPILVTADVERWRLRNPLRRWLDRQPLWDRKLRPLARLLARLGISRQTWYGWLYGTCAPRPSKWALLTRHTGVTADAYMRWLARKPEGEPCAPERLPEET